MENYFLNNHSTIHLQHQLPGSSLATRRTMPPGGVPLLLLPHGASWLVVTQPVRRGWLFCDRFHPLVSYARSILRVRTCCVVCQSRWKRERVKRQKR